MSLSAAHYCALMGLLTEHDSPHIVASLLRITDVDVETWRVTDPRAFAAAIAGDAGLSKLALDASRPVSKADILDALQKIQDAAAPPSEKHRHEALAQFSNRVHTIDDWRKGAATTLGEYLELTDKCRKNGQDYWHYRHKIRLYPTTAAMQKFQDALDYVHFDALVIECKFDAMQLTMALAQINLFDHAAQKADQEITIECDAALAPLIRGMQSHWCEIVTRAS